MKFSFLTGIFSVVSSLEINISSVLNLFPVALFCFSSIRKSSVCRWELQRIYLPNSKKLLRSHVQTAIFQRLITRLNLNEFSQRQQKDTSLTQRGAKIEVPVAKLGGTRASQWNRWRHFFNMGKTRYFPLISFTEMSELLYQKRKKHFFKIALGIPATLKILAGMVCSVQQHATCILHHL